MKQAVIKEIFKRKIVCIAYDFNMKTLNVVIVSLIQFIDYILLHNKHRFMTDFYCKIGEYNFFSFLNNVQCNI